MPTTRIKAPRPVSGRTLRLPTDAEFDALEFAPLSAELELLPDDLAALNSAIPQSRGDRTQRLSAALGISACALCTPQRSVDVPAEFKPLVRSLSIAVARGRV